MTDRIGKIRWAEGARELLQGAYVTPLQGLGLWLKNRGTPYESVPPARWSERKTSDTVFVIGSGPSLETLSPAYWDLIRRHDSFGINYSFVKGVPTTYHMFAYERPGPSGDVAGTFRSIFTPELRRAYARTLWFMPSKSLFRLVHPAILPEYFPERARLAVFHAPHPVELDADRPFRREDFADTLQYRGSIGVVLTLIDRLAYKNVVLLGIDPQTAEHFVYKHPTMAEEGRKYYSVFDPKSAYPSMTPKGKRYRTIEEYYYALRELHFAPKGVRLYLGKPNPVLSPRIPVYPAGAAL